MFLSGNYILANELIQKMGIHIANISMLRSQFEEENDFTTLKKMNNCTFINTKSHKLPNNIKQGIANNEFSDISNKLPCTWLKTEFDVSEKEWFNSGIINGKDKICGKDFYVFDQEFVQKMKFKVPYILDEKETMECIEKKQILGYIKLSKNKYFTWY